MKALTLAPRNLLKGLLITLSIISLLPLKLAAQAQPAPNVILIITDDQGYGDFGWTGNPHIKTPVLDAFAAKSIRFDQFYVSPVCAPTRSSLMTGRYSLRTGVRDTYNGGAIMASSEVTIAELLKQANYATGIFGKWHLGDNYPCRPNDQGFDESLIHLAGGMGQVGDFTNFFKDDRSYFDPDLWHNGQPRSYKGYCSDIFADEAVKFIEANQQQPFFCYLSFNAPHTPLQVPDVYYNQYKDLDPSTGFDQTDCPFPAMTAKDKEDARKVYAMVSNIDDNIGKVLNKVEELNLSEQTIIIFMTDNGPQQKRFVSGKRGLKGSVYRGGVNVPFLFSYPGQFQGNSTISTSTAHIDILPTLAELCGFNLPANRHIDGKSMVPLLKREPVDWAGRSLFFYWTRRYPEKYKNIALQQGDYKLVGQADYDAPIDYFQLFNLSKDPCEQESIVASNQATADRLKLLLDSVYNDLIRSPNLLNPPRIAVGTQQENPVFLNRNDAGGERGIWRQQEVFGKWAVDIQPGTYNFKFKFLDPLPAEGRMVLEINEVVYQKEATPSASGIIEMNQIALSEIKGDLIPTYISGRKNILPFWVEIERVSTD